MNFKTILANVHGDSYYFHRLVESAFPNQKKAFFKHNDTLVVYSEKGPICTYTSDVILTETTEFNINALLKNPTKMFTLEVNPVRRSRETGNYVKVDANDVNDWLKHKAEKFGCEVVQSFTQRSFWDVFEQGSKGRTISLHCYILNGIMKITNPELFTEKYFSGIGQGKAFGYGLVQMLN